MKVAWYLDGRNTNMVNGDFYTAIVNAHDSATGTPYGVVRDRLYGFNVVRVDFDSKVPQEEWCAILENLLLTAEIRFNQLKGN